MAKKPSLDKAVGWTSEILEEKILRALEVSRKQLEVVKKGKANREVFPGRWVKGSVISWEKKISSLKSQIKELNRGLGGVILTDPAFYKKTGLFKIITENLGDPSKWTDDLSEALTASIKKYGGAMTYTDQVSEFNPAGKVGHHRTALSALREAIAPLDVNVRSEFKRLALRDGYKLGEEYIDYLDPAAHMRMNQTLKGILAKKNQKPSQKLLDSLTERSAHAAVFGHTQGFSIPKGLIKEGANADEVYRLAKPYLELNRRAAEAGLQLDDILTSNRWNTNNELMEILQKEMPVQDVTPVLNKMRVDLMDAGLVNPAGLRTQEYKDWIKESGMQQVPDRSTTRLTVDQMRANQWEVPDEVLDNAKAISLRSAAANQFKHLDVTKIGKAATGLNKADSLARFAAGDYVGGGLGLAMNTNAFRNALTKRLTKVAGKQFAGLLPGVGIGMSAMESAGYAAQGRLTQAGIAALSGAVGEVPVIGDLFAGGLDLLNTGIDVATGNLMPDLDDPELGGLRRAAKYARQ